MNLDFSPFNKNLNMFLDNIKVATTRRAKIEDTNRSISILNNTNSPLQNK
jgi:hypothetical protein